MKVSNLVDRLEQLEEQIDRLARFLLENYPDEIGAGDPVEGESAVDVAIRLLSLRVQ